MDNSVTRKLGEKACILRGDSLQLATLLTQFSTIFPFDTTENVTQSNLFTEHLQVKASKHAISCYFKHPKFCYRNRGTCFEVEEKYTLGIP